jgi:hypothetical protein
MMCIDKRDDLQGWGWWLTLCSAVVVVCCPLSSVALPGWLKGYKPNTKPKTLEK